MVTLSPPPVPLSQLPTTALKPLSRSWNLPTALPLLPVRSPPTIPSIFAYSWLTCLCLLPLVGSRDGPGPFTLQPPPPLSLSSHFCKDCVQFLLSGPAEWRVFPVFSPNTPSSREVLPDLNLILFLPSVCSHSHALMCIPSFFLSLLLWPYAFQGVWTSESSLQLTSEISPGGRALQRVLPSGGCGLGPLPRLAPS